MVSESEYYDVYKDRPLSKLIVKFKNKAGLTNNSLAAAMHYTKDSIVHKLYANRFTFEEIRSVAQKAGYEIIFYNPQTNDAILYEGEQK